MMNESKRQLPGLINRTCHTNNMSTPKDVKEKLVKVIDVAADAFAESYAEGFPFPTVCICYMPNGNTEYYAIEDLHEDNVEQAVELASKIGALQVVIVGEAKVLNAQNGEEDSGVCAMFFEKGHGYTLFQIMNFDDDMFDVITGKLIDLGKKKITDYDMKDYGFEP